MCIGQAVEFNVDWQKCSKTKSSWFYIFFVCWCQRCCHLVFFEEIIHSNVVYICQLAQSCVSLMICRCKLDRCISTIMANCSKKVAVIRVRSSWLVALRFASLKSARKRLASLQSFIICTTLWFGFPHGHEGSLINPNRFRWAPNCPWPVSVCDNQKLA